MSQQIWAHTLVKNEDKYLYFSVKSVINEVEKMLLWDTGSTDKTLLIIDLLKKEYPEKIDVKKFNNITADGLTDLRQKMLDETAGDWFILVDGDEVWWEKSLKQVRMTINKNPNLYCLVNPVINLVGDIYHYQEEEAGNYQVLNKKGHFNIRVINRNIPGLVLKRAYPNEGYYDKWGNIIQRVSSRVKYIDAPILHFSFLKRSSIEDKKITFHRNKYKYEIGVNFSKDFEYPEVLLMERPNIVDDPFVKLGRFYKMRALLETPLKKIKRRLRK